MNIKLLISTILRPGSVVSIWPDSVKSKTSDVGRYRVAIGYSCGPASGVEQVVPFVVGLELENWKGRFCFGDLGNWVKIEEGGEGKDAGGGAEEEGENKCS